MKSKRGILRLKRSKVRLYPKMALWAEIHRRGLLKATYLIKKYSMSLLINYNFAKTAENPKISIEINLPYICMFKTPTLIKKDLR